MSWIDDANADMERRRQERLENPINARSAASKYAMECRLKINPESQSKAGKEAAKLLVKWQEKTGYLQSDEHRENARRGAITSGNNNVKSGHWARVIQAGYDASNAPAQCTECGERGTRLLITRYHDLNCPYPAIKPVIETNKPVGDIRIKPYVKKIAKLAKANPNHVMGILKKMYLVPSKHHHWKWDPIKEGEEHRSLHAVVYKKLPYTDPDRLNKLAKMLYDLIPFDESFTIMQLDLDAIQEQCEYKLSVRTLLMDSPKFFKLEKIKNKYYFKKL